MSSGLRSSVQKPRKGEANSLISGASAARSFETDPFADEHLHALGELLPSFGQIRGLVTVTNAAGEIGVQVVAGKQRRMAVDMLALKRSQLLHAFGILVQDAGHVHELGQANHLGMVAMWDQVGGR